MALIFLVMPSKSAAEKAIPSTQDYPPNTSFSYPERWCVSRKDIPIAHSPRDVGLQRLFAFGRVLSLADITRSSPREKGKAKEKKNEKGREREREREDAPPFGVLWTQVLADG